MFVVFHDNPKVKMLKQMYFMLHIVLTRFATPEKGRASGGELKIVVSPKKAMDGNIDTCNDGEDIDYNYEQGAEEEHVTVF